MMKQLKIFVLGLVTGILALGFAVLTINPLSNQLVTAVMWYQLSDEKKALYLQGFNLARNAIDNYFQQGQGQKPPAVIVDIDETMLDNSPFEAMLAKTGQTFNHKLWNDWVKQERAKALPGAVEFTNYAQMKGVEVFYISNRREHNLEHTLNNLQRLGFSYADKEHLLLRTTTGDKTERRNKILEKYDVICYIGDNMGDFDQKYVPGSSSYSDINLFNDSHLFGTKYIVMPNPMYGNWARVKYPENVKTDEQKALYNIQLLKD